MKAHAARIRARKSASLVDPEADVVPFGGSGEHLRLQRHVDLLADHARGRSREDGDDAEADVVGRTGRAGQVGALLETGARHGRVRWRSGEGRGQGRKARVERRGKDGSGCSCAEHGSLPIDARRAGRPRSVCARKRRPSDRRHDSLPKGRRRVRWSDRGGPRGCATTRGRCAAVPPARAKSEPDRRPHTHSSRWRRSARETRRR